MFELLPVHGSFSKPTVTLNILAYSNTSSLLTHLTTFNTKPFKLAYILFLFLFIPFLFLFFIFFIFFYFFNPIFTKCTWLYIPFPLIMHSRPPRMAPSPRHSGVRRISGLIPNSTVQVKVGAHGSSSGPTHDPSPHDSLSSFSIHYTNIRGLNSNFSSFESHLATSPPNLFLLSETQLSSQSSPDPFQISHYNLYSRFRSKGGVCAYCNINTPIARLMDLESPHFDVLWQKIYLPTTTIFLCFCYCSPNATNFPSFFEYFTSCHESLLSSHPHAEVLYIGDFNVHHTDWLKSTHTDVGRIEAFHFSISNELEQIIKHPTRVLIVMTMQQTLLTYSLHLTLRNILTLSPLLWDPLTIVLFQLLQLLLHHHLSLPLSVIFGTLRTTGVLI